MAHIAIAYNDIHACSPWILGHNKINLAWSMRRSLDKIKKPSISLGTYYGNYLRCDRSNVRCGTVQCIQRVIITLPFLLA